MGESFFSPVLPAHERHERRTIATMPAIVEVLAMTTHSSDVEAPTIYGRAMNEFLVLTILICAAITYFANPEVYSDNGILKMFGYNNPCIVWDTPPALYVAQFIM